MFLSITNLPHDVKVERLKQVIKEQCYVENIIMDDLKDQGKKKKCIMIGFMDKIDASVVLAKLDGYFLDGNKLSVRVVQQKTKQPELTKSAYESPLAKPSQYQIPTPPPPPMNAGIPNPPAPPLFSSMAGALRPPAPPLFPTAGNAGMLRSPLFTAAANYGLLPSAPPLIRPAPPLNQVVPPLNPVAPTLNPVAPQLNPVAPPSNPVSLALKPVASVKTAKKLPRLKFKIAPPIQQQPSISTNSMPFYAIQQPASIKNPLPEKNKLSQGSTIHRDGHEKAETENVSSQHELIIEERKKIFGQKTEHQNSRCLRSKSKSYSPHRKLRNKSRSPNREPRNKSRSPHRRPRSKSRSPRRRRRSKSQSPYRRLRSKSRSPHRRPRSRSRSPNRGRSFFGRLSDGSNRYNRDRFASRFPDHYRFGYSRYSPDHKRNRKRTRYDGRERDSRHSRSHSSERLNKRKRTESPKSDDDDRIALNREHSCRRSPSCNSDQEDERERTVSPIILVRETVTTEESLAPIIPQMNLNANTNLLNNESTVSPFNNENTYSNLNYYNHLDPHGATFSVHNPHIAEDGSVPTNTYYQTPTWYPPNYEESTNPLHRTNPYFQIGFVPLPQNPQSSNQNFPMNSSFQAGSIPPPQNVTIHNPYVPINPNFQTRFVSPSQNNSAPTQAGYVPQPQNITTFSKNVPSSAHIQAGYVSQPQNITTFNKNVPSSAHIQAGYVSQPQNITTFSKNVPSSAHIQAGYVSQPQNITTFNKNVPSSAHIQAGYVSQPQNITTFNKNIPSSAHIQAGYVSQPQNITTFNKNVPSSAHIQAGYVSQPQNITTFNKNIPSSAHIQAGYVSQPQNITTFNKNVRGSAPTQAGHVPQPQNTFNEGVPKLQNQEVLNNKRKLVPTITARVVKELLSLYRVGFVPKPVFTQIKQIYFKRIKAIPANNIMLNVEEAHEYYKVLYPYSNEKLVLETVLGRKVRMLDEDQPNPENRQFVNTRFNSMKANDVTQAMGTSPPAPPSEQSDDTYVIKCDGVDRDQIYEAALDKELKALEVTFMRACGHYSEPDINKVSKMLKQKGVHDFFKGFKIHILKDVYGKMAFVLKITYEVEISDQNLIEFMNNNNLEMLKHDKTAKFITAMCKDSKNFYKMLAMKTVQICGETLQIQRQNTINKELLFANIESIPNMSKNKNMVTNNNIIKEFEDVNKQVLKKILTEDIKNSSNTQVSECDTPKDEEHVNTMPTKADQENKQCIDESGTYNVKCDTPMKEYVDLSSVEQENMPCIKESSNPYSTKCDKLMEENINLTSSKLEQKNTQCIQESNKTQIAKCEKPVRQHVHTFTKETEQENTQGVEESNNAHNRRETQVGEFINIRAELEPESTQSIEEHNNTHLTRYDKPVESFVNTLSVEVAQKNTQCIEQSNKTHDCDTPKEKLVNVQPVDSDLRSTQCSEESNVPPAELESEINIEDSNKKQNAECDTLMQKNNNMPPAELKPENIQCTEEFTITRAECDSPMVHGKVLPAQSELENTKCIKESNKIHNAECDIPMEEYVNVQPVDSDLRSSQCSKESNAPPAKLQSEITIEDSNKKQNYECDTLMHKYNYTAPAELKPKNIQCTGEFTNTHAECDSPMVHIKVLPAKLELENTKCIKESNKIHNAECDIPMEEYVNVQPVNSDLGMAECVTSIEGYVKVPTELETYCIEESISKQKTESDTTLRQYVMVPSADSDLKSTQCTEESSTHNTESRKPVEELVEVKLQEENTQCVEESNKTKNAECDTSMEEYIKVRPTELETESIRSIEESVTQKSESDTHIGEHVKVPPAELKPESTQCIELLNSTENIECIDQSNYTQNTACDTSMDDQIANTLAEIELCLLKSNFDFDNLSNNFNEIDDTISDVKSEIIKTDVVIEEKLDATLATEVEDDDLEDF